MSIFQFKQFAVHQTGCAMKINTDGVLLGALTAGIDPQQILDIGTGTGVISLMLAQRFPLAFIEALEIDKAAAEVADQNFNSSAFNERLQAYPLSFQDFFNRYPKKRYSLIVSNPPFYLDALKSPNELRTVAKHTDQDFFDSLIKMASLHLADEGVLWLVLPVSTSYTVQEVALGYNLNLLQKIDVKSYPHSEPHRHIVAFGFDETVVKTTDFVIYQSPKQYTPQYQDTLRSFFTIF